MILRQRMPTLKQVLLWNHYVVQRSPFNDPLLGFRFGKFIFGISLIGEELSI